MSSQILSVVASISGESSSSRILASEASRHLLDQTPGGKLVVRDTSQLLSPIDSTWTQAAYTPEAQRSAQQRQRLQLSDELIDELVQADHLIIATPMYNFSVPSGLRVWIDHVARAGVTFQYTESGPKGLLEDKPVTLIVSTGGVKLDSPADFVTPYLRQVLGFVGLHSIRVVAADGMAVSAQESMTRARQQLRQTLQPAAHAA